MESEADGRASSPEPPGKRAGTDEQKPSDSAAAVAASRELQIHELVALASCFIFPLIGTWLLHTIRSKLSRPSEGLVSNYNLTIFLLASEIRPFSHLLKMVQARTLHLQRIVTLSSEDEKGRIDVLDLAKRLEELEAHVSETAAARLSAKSPNRAQHSAQDPEVVQLTVIQATAEVRKTFQADIDALNRAVRRYEKRTAVSAYQADSRLHALETQIHDAVSLAAAAHRTSTRYPWNLLLTMVRLVYAAFLLPMQVFISVASLPMHVSISCFRYLKSMLFSIYSPAPTPAKDKALLDKARSPKRSRRVSSEQDAVGRHPLDPIEETK